MSRTITISLSYGVAHDLEVRAAIDDLNLSDGAALLITEIVTRWRAAYPSPYPSPTGRGYSVRVARKGATT